MFPLNAHLKYYFVVMEEKNPVVLKLEGGLGNQLFELAAGFYLAAKLSTELQLDQYSIPITTVHGETCNGFSELVIPSPLNSKGITLLEGLPSKGIVRLTKRSKIAKKVILKVRMFSSNRHKLQLFLESNELDSKKEFFEIQFPMKLHGNFQSWDIVERAAQNGFPRILSLREVPNWIESLEKTIDFKQSIVLHFRVGIDARNNYSFKQPNVSYYLAALDILRDKKNFVGVYILSDEIERVKEMFGSKLDKDFHYLAMPAESSPAERLYVLSLFGAIVCANSTFCGWAAWSISNAGGEAVVPIPYSDGLVLGSRDFPSNWIKLDKYTGAVVS
jgi:hypothetical protein